MQARRVLEPVALPGVVDVVLAKQPMDDLELLPEVCDPLPGGAEGEAVGRVLALHPAGSHPERDAPTGDLVRGRG